MSDYVKCEECGEHRLIIGGTDLGCAKCQSAKVAPNVLRWHADPTGEPPEVYARSLIDARDRNYCRSFDRDADVKLARALLEANEAAERAWSDAIAEAASLVSSCIIDNPNRYGDRLDALAEEIRSLKRET